MLRPGFVKMQGQWPYDYDMQDHESTPLLTTLNRRTCSRWINSRLSCSFGVPCDTVPPPPGCVASSTLAIQWCTGKRMMRSATASIASPGGVCAVSWAKITTSNFDRSSFPKTAVKTRSGDEFAVVLCCSSKRKGTRNGDPRSSCRR